jgi:hypothetical protein
MLIYEYKLDGTKQQYGAILSPPVSTLRQDKPQPSEPGSRSLASIPTARTTSRARRATRSSSAITGAWSTSRRAGSWNLMGSISGLPTAVASDAFGSLAIQSSTSRLFLSHR